ncbi:MAG: long-chain acyl-CoA synthetase [Alphaproteobacteria bacterium]|nr:long-chain acyl-CoA synthetase [Alphaproteobacteria bacterium]
MEQAGPQLLRQWIDRAAGRDPDKTFIVAADDGRTLTYGQLRELTGRIATYLRDQGIGRNDRIALFSNNSIEHLAAYFGVLAYGATICTVHVEMHRNQFDNILPVLKPRLVLCEDGLGLDDVLKAASSRCLPLGEWDDRRGDSFFAAVNRCEPGDGFADAGPDDGAVILFTSGTSARPKGVVLSFRELLTNAGPTADGFDLTAQDRIYDFRSFNWCSAQTLSAVPPLCRGATLILGRKFSRSRFFEHIRQHGATIATGNPTTLGILLNGDGISAPDLPALRFMTSSSAPLLVDEWRRFEDRFGIRVSQGYGCSEIGWIAAQPGEQRRIGTVGRPHPYHRLSIVGPEGQSLKPGEMGAVELGGLRGNAYRTLADDGSFRVDCRDRMKTGDLGFLDDEGYLHLTGRAKDLIIRGGVNISPLEIDGVLMRQPDVIEACTVGVPDKLYGEEVVAYVVLRPGAAAAAAEILHHCATMLPAFKTPKQIVVSDELPKTERGKLDRKALVERWGRAVR